MKPAQWLHPGDLDVEITDTQGLERLLAQGLVDLTPWHLMDRQAARQRMDGLRSRYTEKYVPFARRQDNDDIACFDPAVPGQVVVLHDFASRGYERRRSYPSFWDWFRSAVEEMIDFD